MIVDSHCHLASKSFSPSELPDLIRRAKDAGVGRMVTLATCLGDVEQNLEIAKRPEVFAALGIHPCDVHDAPDDAVRQLAGYLGDERVCAVGETGLDYYHPAPDGWTEERFRERQKRFLREHFRLASEAGLNVVIHTRDREGSGSFVDALEIYREFSDKVRAVFHCFVSQWSQAEMVIKEGGLVSFGGVATFKKSEKVRDAVVRCPVESFMLETDSPYLAPEPYRGRRNEPAFTAEVANKIAAIRNETLEEVERHTLKAAERFFRWVI